MCSLCSCGTPNSGTGGVSNYFIDAWVPFLPAGLQFPAVSQYEDLFPVLLILLGWLVNIPGRIALFGGQGRCRGGVGLGGRDRTE